MVQIGKRNVINAAEKNTLAIGWFDHEKLLSLECNDCNYFALQVDPDSFLFSE